MMALVERTLDLRKSAARREVVQRQSNAMDRRIDAPAYALYGLSEAEVEVVEG